MHHDRPPGDPLCRHRTGGAIAGRWALLIAPVVTWLVTFWVCRSLRRSRLHPARVNAGLRLRRTRDGGLRDCPPGADLQR
jgi:hypothetical protein